MFASPTWFWLGLVAVPIVGLYILRTRPRRHVVSTLLFWDQIFDDKRQRAWWQNLRRWLSLLLQLLFVALLVFAVADPLWNAGDDDRQETILIVDNSASMNAGGGTTRLDDAKRRAAEIASGLRDGDSMALVTAGSTVRVAAGMGDFAPSVIRAIEAIPTTDGPTRIDEAIESARRLSSDPDRRRIIVISDQTRTPDDDVNLVRLGQTAGNVAITAIQARRSLVDPIGYACWIEVQNLSDQSSTGRLTLRLGEELVDVMPLELEPDAVWRRTIEATSAAGGVLTASLEISAGQDGLAVDNLARAVVSPRPPVGVRLVVGEGQSESPQAFFLRSVFGSMPGVQLIDQDAAAITVYAGTVPDAFPSGAIVVVAPPRDGPPESWTVSDEMESPIVATQADDSPLLRHVRMQNVPLDASRAIEIDEALGVVEKLFVTADDKTVAASVDRPDGRMLILATQLESGDLPLRVAFPVLMTNAVNWLLQRSGDVIESLHTGQESDRGPAQDRVGMVDMIAVNLCDAAESDLRTAGDQDDVPVGLSKSGRPPWWILICVAFGLIVVEWSLFQRRVVA